MSRVRDYIQKKHKESGVSVREFAAQVGISYTSMRSYLEIDRSSEPSAEKVEQILEALGGDITRAFPEYIPPTVSETLVSVQGSVAAGHATISQVPTEYELVLEKTFRPSRFWSHTQGPVIYLRVQGSSMEPQFPAGSLIACRAPMLPLQEIRDGSPCIFVDRYSEATFKALKHGDKGVYGLPFNLDHEVHHWKYSDVTIQYIVLGIVSAIEPSVINGKVLRDAQG